MSQPIREHAVAQAARRTGEKVELIAAWRFWKQEQNDEINWPFIDCVEVQRPIEPGKNAERLMDFGETRVRDRYSVAESRRAQRFACHQSV